MALSMKHTIRSITTSSSPAYRHPELLVGMKLIPETSYAICITSKGSEFYYNLFEKVSCWVPPEDVKRRMDEIIAVNKERALAERGALSLEEEQLLKDKANGNGNTSLKRPHNGPESTAPDPASPASKKHKLDVTLAPPPKPDADLVSDFIALLHDHSVSPFALLDSVLEVVFNDPRSKQCPPHLQNSAFLDYCSSLAAKSNSAAKKSPRDKFLDLLNERCKPKWDFREVERLCRRDPRFALVKDSGERREIWALWKDGPSRVKLELDEGKYEVKEEARQEDKEGVMGWVKEENSIECQKQQTKEEGRKQREVAALQDRLQTVTKEVQSLEGLNARRKHATTLSECLVVFRVLTQERLRPRMEWTEFLDLARGDERWETVEMDSVWADIQYEAKNIFDGVMREKEHQRRERIAAHE